MPPNSSNRDPSTEPPVTSDPLGTVDRLRHMLADKEARELATLNKERSAQNLPALTELPKEEILSSKSGALHPPKDLAVQRVLRPNQSTVGKDASAGRDEAPELVPDPKNPGQFIMKDFLPEE